jgi:flavin reductase (DIM6/NTAB) family NADH-FMN oxidoreductase RutF
MTATVNFDVAQLAPQDCYRLLIGSVLPRPIAWISSLSADGVANLAPFSFFTVASIAPPVLAVTHVNPRNTQEKDTLRNLRATGECVVNIVSHALVEQMNASCASHPPQVSEFDAAAVAKVASLRVAPPGVAAAPVRIECRLREVLAFSQQPMGGQMMLLDVLHIHARADALRDGILQPELVDAVGKLGGDGYSTIRERFELARPLL